MSVYEYVWVHWCVGTGKLVKERHGGGYVCDLGGLHGREFS